MHAQNSSPARRLSEYDRLARRLLESSDSEARANVRRMLAFISETPPLTEAVLAAPQPKAFTGLELANVLYTGQFQLPTQPNEELGMAILMLRAIAADEDKVAFCNYTLDLPPITDADAQAREFMRRYIYPSILFLRDVLVELLPEVETPPPLSVSVVTQPGGISQTNIAQHRARLEARQSVSVNLPETRAAAERLLEALSTISEAALPAESRQDLEEYATLVIRETNQDTPQPSRLRWIGTKLMRIVEVINASDAVYQAGSTLARILLSIQ